MYRSVSILTCFVTYITSFWFLLCCFILIFNCFFVCYFCYILCLVHVCDRSLILVTRNTQSRCSWFRLRFLSVNSPAPELTARIRMRDRDKVVIKVRVRIRVSIGVNKCCCCCFLDVNMYRISSSCGTTKTSVVQISTTVVTVESICPAASQKQSLIMPKQK